MACLISLLSWLASCAIYAEAAHGRPPRGNHSKRTDPDATPIYEVAIGLYDQNMDVLWESATADPEDWGTGPEQFGWIKYAYPLCPDSPDDCDGVTEYIGGSKVWNAEGGNNLFNYLETQQVAIPASFAQKVRSIRITVKTPDQDHYRVLYNEEWVHNKGKDWPSGGWSEDKPAPTIEYPSDKVKPGEPLHLSILDSLDGEINGGRIVALWLGFRSEPSCDPGNGDHCCYLKDANDDLWDTSFYDGDNNCWMGAPSYRCYQEDGSAWSSGDRAHFINFEGSLVGMTDGKPISIHFDDHVQSSIPFTNSYVQTEVDSDDMISRDGCNTVCEFISGDSEWVESKWQSAIGACKVKQSKVLAASGLGPVSISGYGRISGFKLMDSGPDYFGQQVWKDFGGTNGGNYFEGGAFKDHFKQQEWSIMSGLAELTSSDSSYSSSSAFAIRIRDIAVAWGPKRGDGAVLINAPYRQLDDDSDSNTPASLWDIKTPGAWVDAADGPNLLGDNSQMQFAYLHHADDTVKISASGVTFSGITALQGNVGSVIELGNYGDGLRTVGDRINNVLENCLIDRLSIHRIVHSQGGYDGNGGVMGSRTCPNGVQFKEITVKNVDIPELSGANTVGQLFAIGAVKKDAPFCDGTVYGHVYFHKLNFYHWRINVNPSMESKFFGQQGEHVTVDDIAFYDRHEETEEGKLDSAVQIFDSPEHYYCVCATSEGADQCWDSSGPGRGAENMFYEDVHVNAIWFPYGPAKSLTKSIFV